MKKTFVFILCILSFGSFASQRKGSIDSQIHSKIYFAIDTSIIRILDTITVGYTANKSFTRSKRNLVPYIAPLALISYGSLSLQNRTIIRIDHQLNHEMMEGKEHFSSPIEDKLQYAPVAAVYTLNALGLKGKSNFIDRTAMYLIANSLTGLTVSYGKDHFKKLRPSGELRSFPSGHTATAFTAAEFMFQEYKDTSPFVCYAGFSMATLTGVLRMTHNRHWLSDVVAGAGVGILSTKVTYLIYPWLKHSVFHENGRSTILPSYSDRVVGLTFSSTF